MRHQLGFYKYQRNILIRACDAASSYHYPSTITGSKIPKLDCIFNCCSECHGMKAPDLEPSKYIDHSPLVPIIR